MQDATHIGFSKGTLTYFKLTTPVNHVYEWCNFHNKWILSNYSWDDVVCRCRRV